MASPAAVKRMVCLANSRKMSGRCVAGREILPDGRLGGWFRPVSAREDEEVSERERQYAGGGDPRLLDVIDVPVLGARPTLHQRENWLLDPQRRWEFVRRVRPSELARLADPPAPLWVDGYSSLEGLNDRVHLRAASGLRDSLRLIWTDNLALIVSAPWVSRGDFRRVVRARFRYQKTDYGIRVTDPAYEERYLEMPVGEYPIGGRFITASLAERPYHGYYYKLIAAIIEPESGAAP